MSTPLDLAELRSRSPLDAATYLTGRTMAELRALALALGLRLKGRGAQEKIDLVNAILRETHPAAPTARPATIAEQTRFA